MQLASPSNRLLITGITGFTGKHLSHHFKELGYEIYGLTASIPTQENHIQCDLCDHQAVMRVIQKIQPDYVIHLAGIAFVAENNAAMIYNVNVTGACNLLDALSALVHKPKKVILASSGIIYGDQGNHEVLDESMCPHPINHYGCSKLAMEQIALMYKAKLPIIVVRPFNYTGIGQDSHFLIPKIVTHYQQQKSHIELGNLHVEREFNDIRDICTMYGSLLLSNAMGETVNLCTGRGIALLDVIEMMNEIAGYEIDVGVNPAFVRPNEIKRLVGSSTKLEEIIGKLSLHPFHETLKNIYNGVK